MLVAAAALTGAPSQAGPLGPGGQILHAGSPAAVKDSYLVVLRDNAMSTSAVESTATGLATRFGGKVERTYSSALRGFAVSMGEAEARKLALDPSVAYVEQNQVFRTTDAQDNPPSWGLDRIDQKANERLIDNSFRWHSSVSGLGVRAYVIDTGIRVTHLDFGNTRAIHGYDFVDNDAVADDCNGHGTHVAGTIAGTSYGVAKQAYVVAVRVLNCFGQGTTVGVVAGVDWVTANATQAAVANMSLGGPASNALDTAVTNSINAGISYVVAAGNSNADACGFSPARVPGAITVGATASNDVRSTWLGNTAASNFGTCVDVFAPGSAIRSAWHVDDTATAVLDGTSMAAPHVAGVVAQYLDPGPAWTPQEISDWLITNATPNVVIDPGTGSPNRLLHSAWWGPMGQVTCSSSNGSFGCQAINKEAGSAAWTGFKWWLNGVRVVGWNGQSTPANPCQAGFWYWLRVEVTNTHGHTDEFTTGVRCVA